MASQHVKTRLILPTDLFPNNELLALVIYPEAIPNPTASFVESVFASSGWEGNWRDGVYDFQHYHSRAHEVLGVYSGDATLKLGGEDGEIFEVAAGDVVVIPAGVAHKRINASEHFRVVGSYPPGQRPDICYGKHGERPEADDRIANVPLPITDPVTGEAGPLLTVWK